MLMPVEPMPPAVPIPPGRVVRPPVGVAMGVPWAEKGELYPPVVCPPSDDPVLSTPPPVFVIYPVPTPCDPPVAWPPPPFCSQGWKPLLEWCDGGENAVVLAKPPMGAWFEIGHVVGDRPRLLRGELEDVATSARDQMRGLSSSLLPLASSHPLSPGDPGCRCRWGKSEDEWPLWRPDRSLRRWAVERLSVDSKDSPSAPVTYKQLQQSHNDAYILWHIRLIFCVGLHLYAVMEQHSLTLKRGPLKHYQMHFRY